MKESDLNKQNGIAETKIAPGKSATVSAIVAERDTAKAVGSGSLDVFATPMMIALMERAACECLADCLGGGQTSVGALINVEHVAASSVGAEVSATATIDSVLGRRIEFIVIAASGDRVIGKGKHTRVIVDVDRFIAGVK